MPCEFCPADGDESKCPECRGRRWRERKGRVESPRTRKRVRVLDMTGAACFALFLGVVVAWLAGKLLAWW